MRRLVVCVAVLLWVAACSSQTPVNVGPSGSPMQTISPMDSPLAAPTPIPFDAPLLIDPQILTGICAPPPADADDGIRCEDACREAMRAAGPHSVHVYRLEFAYGAPCTTSDPCTALDADVGYVILRSTDQKSLVLVRRGDDGRPKAWPPEPTRLDLFPPSLFIGPATERPSLPGDLPSELAERTPLPFCGRAELQRAAPTAAELCFRDAVLAGQAAELMAVGKSVEGGDLIDLLRYVGNGAISRDVFQSTNALGEPGGWQHALTVLRLQSNGGIEL